MVVSLDRFRITKRVKFAVEMSYGEHIELARQNIGLTQTQLGVAVGYHPSAISRMENDRVSVSPTDAALISKVLGCADLAEEYCYRCPVAAALKQLHGQPKPAA